MMSVHFHLQPPLHRLFNNCIEPSLIKVKRFYLYMKLLQSGTIFKQKKSLSALRLKFA